VLTGVVFFLGVEDDIGLGEGSFLTEGREFEEEGLGSAVEDGVFLTDCKLGICFLTEGNSVCESFLRDGVSCLTDGREDRELSLLVEVLGFIDGLEVAGGTLGGNCCDVGALGF